MEKPEQKPQDPPAEYRSPSQLKPEDLEKLASTEEGGAPPEPEKKPEPSKPAEPAKPAEKPDAPKSLLDLAKDKDAARKAEQARALEQAKPVLDVAKDYDPRRLEALVRAAKAGDMVGLLAAAGGTHQQYTQQLLGVAGARQSDPKQPDTDPAPGAVNPEVQTLQQRLAALEQERQEERIARGRQEYLGLIGSSIKDKPEFKALNIIDDAAERVEKRLIGFWESNGRVWPEGVSREDLITLAARDEEREVAAELEKQEKRIAKFRGLTASPSSGAVSPQKAPASPPSTGSESPRTLTNENTTAPAVTRHVPKSREAVLEAIIKGDDAALAELGD